MKRHRGINQCNKASEKIIEVRSNGRKVRSDGMIACVAGGIVSGREIKFWRRSRQASGEAARRMGSGTLKYRLQENHSFFNSPHTSVREKRIGREK